MKPHSSIVPAIFTMLGYKSVDPGIFRPNSHERITVAQAEANYKDFMYKGPGWYPHPDYLLLVLPAIQVDKAEGPGVELVPWTTRLHGTDAKDNDQLFWFFAFDPIGEAPGWPSPVDTFAYIASLPFHEPGERRAVEVIASRSLDDVEGGKPIEVHIQPGTRLRLITADSDGAFDVMYDWKGDGRLVISTDLPGNVMGREGPLYVEDFHRDTTGLDSVKEEMRPATPEGEEITARFRDAVLAMLPAEGYATAEQIHDRMRHRDVGLVAETAAALGASGIVLVTEALTVLVEDGRAVLESIDIRPRRYQRQTSIDTEGMRNNIRVTLAEMSKGSQRYSAAEIHEALSRADRLGALTLAPERSQQITVLAALLTKMGDAGVLDFDIKTVGHAKVGSWRLAPARTPNPFHAATGAAEARATLSDKVILLQELRAKKADGTIVYGDIPMLAHLEEWLLANPTVATDMARATLEDIEALRHRPASPLLTGRLLPQRPVARVKLHMANRIARVKSTGSGHPSAPPRPPASSPATEPPAIRAGAFDADAFFSALDAVRIARGKNWKQLAQEAGISASTLTRMAQGKRPDVDSLAAIAAWSGLSVDDYVRGRELVAPQEPLAMISTYLRSDKPPPPPRRAPKGDGRRK